jgi:hypothetical protein
MANKGRPDLHVTARAAQATVRRAGLSGEPGRDVPLVALEIQGRPCPNAADESLRLLLTVEVARALAGELIAQSDHAERLARN